MKIQAGKFYVDRVGAIIGPMVESGEKGDYVFRGRSSHDKTNCFFTASGHFDESGNETKFDLVAEHIDHAAECERLRGKFTEILNLKSDFTSPENFWHSVREIAAEALETGKAH